MPAFDLQVEIQVPDHFPGAAGRAQPLYWKMQRAHIDSHFPECSLHLSLFYQTPVFPTKTKDLLLTASTVCRATWIVVKGRHLVLWICLWAKDMCLLTDPSLSPSSDKTQNTTLIQWLHKQRLINIWDVDQHLFYIILILSDFISGSHFSLRLVFPLRFVCCAFTGWTT